MAKQESEWSEYKLEGINKTVQSKRRMLDALKVTLGVVSPALKTSQVARNTYYNWLRDDEEFKKAVNGLKDVAHDFVETKMLSRIQDGSDTMMIFYAKTQMKGRGYVERQEIQDVSDTPKVIKIITEDDE